MPFHAYRTSSKCNPENHTTAVCVVDPYSTGAHVAAEAYYRGFKVIAVWSDECGELADHIPHEVAAIEDLYVAEISYPNATVPTLAALGKAIADAAAKVGATFEHIIAGGESGVKVAENLANLLGLRGNSTVDGFENRRDKKFQQEKVKESGLRSVRQLQGTAWTNEVEAFCKQEMPLIIKPVESCGSDGVKLCKTIEEAEQHFELLMSGQRKVGAQGAAVLCQEFLQGAEYVVDCVSRDGVHKCTFVWVYDKREANGGGFVYFGMIPVPSDDPVVQLLIDYTFGCIDALKISNGATHNEVMLTKDGPCLVEVNCRAHGHGGAWLPLTDRCTNGITQVRSNIDIFVDGAAFDAIPTVPRPFHASGTVVMLVSYQEALEVHATPGYETIKALPSFVSISESVVVGKPVKLTVDLFDCAGLVVLVHDDAKAIEADLATIRKLEEDCELFEVITTRRLSKVRKTDSEGHATDAGLLDPAPGC